MRSGRRIAVAVVTCVALAGLLASAAQAAGFSLETFENDVSSAGKASRQAGGHPDVHTFIQFSWDTEPGENGIEGGAEGNAKDVRVNLPVGMLGNPTAFPTCPAADLVDSNGDSKCSQKSIVGHAEVNTAPFPNVPYESPIFNLKHGSDSPALFGFYALNVPIFVEALVRPGDYGISVLSARSSEAQAVKEVTTTFWGVPGDPSHDAQRKQYFEEPQPVPLKDRVPFMTAPTSCPGVAQPFSISANSWQTPDLFSDLSVDTDSEGTPFTFNGCERLPFRPTVSVEASAHAAGGPTGIDVNIKLPQNADPQGLATSHVKSTKITFPKGFTVSASAAAGQGTCSEAEMGLNSGAAPNCPSNSRVGSASVKSPVVDEELEGGLYLATPRENPFHSLIAFYLAVKGPGIFLKLPGKVETDPKTGQIVTTFDNQPEVPYEDVHVGLRGGASGVVLAPEKCGTYPLEVDMTSWAQPTLPVHISTAATINENCSARNFHPGLRAGTTNPVAGTFSPFTLQATRADNEQNLERFEAHLPEGLLGKLADVAICSDADASTGNCPASSQVGTTTVGAGFGANPVYVPEAGHAPTALYLAGPYKGAPYSLVVKVPAQTGPFDLGTVVVRNTLDIDPVTTEVSTVSDPLPQMLEGIPVEYRDLRVEIRRPNFILNPTSCKQMRISATITSNEGTTANPSTPFQMADCERLPFKPKLAITLKGATHRSAHPALQSVLTAKAGEANISRAEVILPKTEFLENAHIKTICTRVQYAAHICPPGSVYGYAKAWSPLLDKPIEGPVYLRSSNHELPDLVASLDGAMHVDLAGRIDAVNARIRNTFEFVPDAPVSKFVLNMQGGKKGLLVNNTELCKHTPRVNATFNGWNEKVEKINPVAKVSCGKKGKKAKGKGRH
jgi:hypothetical protein